jgi:hypothetical protein
MNFSELDIDLGITTMNCTTDEVAEMLISLLNEMRLVALKLRADERVALRRIMSQESGTLAVGDVFRGFTRESEAHKTLRRLRAAQFVRPAITGRWDPDERIEVKAFARLMWDRVGEAGIFSDSPVPVQPPRDDEDVLLMLNEPAASEQETRRWDDEVLDLHDYPEEEPRVKS